MVVLVTVNNLVVVETGAGGTKVSYVGSWKCLVSYIYAWLKAIGLMPFVLVLDNIYDHCRDALFGQSY